MKKFVKAAAVVMILVMAASMFAGCSKTLKGTYKATDSAGGTLTFDKDNKVTGEVFGLSVDGEYEIEDDQITFKYSSIIGVDMSKDFSFEKKGGSIFIDGKEFVKE